MEKLHTFNVDYKSEIDDQRYQGKFTCKKLSIRDLSKVNVRKSQLNGGLYYDEDKPGVGIDQVTDHMNAMIAVLEVALTEAPKWWNLDEIVDVDLLVTVFQEVNSFEGRFHRKGSDRGSQAQENKPESTGRAPAMVDGEVLAALEP